MTAGYGGEWSYPSASEDPTPANNAQTIYLDTPPGCALVMKTQRAVARGLRTKVVAPSSSGCVAKLKSASFKIGKQKYVFVKRRPQRSLAAGKTWTLALPYGANALDVIRRAVSRGRTVMATVEFSIDGEVQQAKARLK